MASANQPRFISLEGGEGVGKSTQIQTLAERLRAAGNEVVTTREPGGPIRDLLVKGDADWHPRTEALLHFAARSEHLENVVHPALKGGKWVVCDRFADSTMAYQGMVQGAGVRYVSELYHLVVGDFAPDLTLVMDMPFDIGLQRAADRGDGEDRYERMGAAFHEKLRQAFLDIVSANQERCVVVDASGTPDDVADAIWQVVADRFGIA